MEILINEHEWRNSKAKRLTEIVDTLKHSGWEKFGNNGTIVFFKDTTKERAQKELNQLGINEVGAEEWEEDLYSNNIF